MMITILVGALLIGITLGLLGSGGSTITVPVLVYFVGHGAKVSIAESMAIVGIISLMAAVPYARSRQVDWQSVWFFGAPGMVGAFVGAWLGGLATDSIQLVVFGTVLLLAAAFMIRKALFEIADVQCEKGNFKQGFTAKQRVKFALEGFVVGLLTGLVGVGGGFLIVPALMVFASLPMRLAISTSLVIIVFKSAIGFAKYQHFLVNHGMSVDWQTIAIFSAVGVVGSFIGQRLNERMNQRSLQQIFAVFLLLIGCFVIIREGSTLFTKQATATINTTTHLIQSSGESCNRQ